MTNTNASAGSAGDGSSPGCASESASRSPERRDADWMRVLVCGGRDFKDSGRVFDVLHDLHRTRRFTTLIEGGALGADEWAALWADACHVPRLKFKADWQAHGRAAGPIRNQRMLTEGRPNLVVAFPGGRGTADMVRRAKAAGIEVIEVPAAPPPTGDRT